MTDGEPRPARTLLVAGTASHVGKSTVVAGLCRRLADRGVSVAPFKAQNMSNNARAVPRADAVRDESESDRNVFGEVGVSQYVQARAARVRPTTDHNPVLLKPRGDGESQLVVDGEAVAHLSAGEYYDAHWDRARTAAADAHARLAADHDVIVAEGAGSIAEINLHDRDLSNVETTRFSDADVLLVADIERGGVFASLVGTLELMPDDVRERVVGAVVTKFRGDRSILEPGLDAFEERTEVPILAVLPYDDPGLPEEDSVSLPAEGERATLGDASPADDGVTVAVPRLPRVSNATDLEPLAAEPGVRVAFVPLDSDLSSADAVVLPGTKNTADDLLACREAGLHDRLRAFDGPVVGLCGGYQLLGERLLAADAEGTGDRTEIPGVGLLPVETAFSPEKRVAAVEWTVDGSGPLAGAAGPVSGYEIHAGETRATAAVETPFTDPDTGASDASLGARRGDALGTYLHGLFENDAARAAFVRRVFEAAAVEPPARESEGDARPADPYDRAATLVSDISLDALFGTDAPFASGSEE
ncbi:cobyric acid synthase [Halopelagius longus]|uniref:Probable cobyric acid synthase n=1 Tax=Halopelagius longus TaxID=1236180 RepID=A0A1H1DJ51_9EURY|nr:cobyric acid synthase [Halopelagius longus]RDI71347.1 cobyric acid synthase [Halopelagius longus]SDQ76269.1 adenosylcobyric acid synthase (glutamine-hydrolysing) [Halopelagius longus]